MSKYLSAGAAIPCQLLQAEDLGIEIPQGFDDGICGIAGRSDRGV
jgi:hypothetical protein